MNEWVKQWWKKENEYQERKIYINGEDKNTENNKRDRERKIEKYEMKHTNETNQGTREGMKRNEGIKGMKRTEIEKEYKE